MNIYYRVSLNVANALAITLSIWIIYQANLGHTRLTSSPRSHERDALDSMCFVVAICGLASVIANLVGSFFVNVESELFKSCYCIVLGVFTVIFLVLAVATVELLDEFEDRMAYDLYEAILHYNESTNKNDFLEKIQADLECCGAKGATKFAHCSSATNCTLPQSCCPKLTNSPPCTNATAYRKTCELKVMYNIEANAQWIVFFMLFMAGYFTVVIALESLFHGPQSLFKSHQTAAATT